MLTLLDTLSEAGGTLKERAPRMHKELVKIVLKMHMKGITARGIERSLKEIADSQIKFKYSQSKYDSYNRETLRKEKKRDYQLLTISTPRIIEILNELEQKEKIVTKMVVAKNYHRYKLREPFEEQSIFWHIQGLTAYHNLMILPMFDNDEQNVEELVKRIGVFVMFVFLNASREFGADLSEEYLNKIRFDYVDRNTNSRFLYNKILRFFIPENQRSIAKADFEYLSSLMKAKYPQYIDRIIEGAKQADDAFPNRGEAAIQPP